MVSSAMKFHEVSKLFPLMEGEELSRLAANIKKNGLRVPIVITDDEQVVDGRNRLTACEMAEVKPKFETTNLTGEELVEFVWSLNAERRQLTKSQRDAAGVEMEAFIEAEEKKARRKSASAGGKAKAAKVNGSSADVSADTSAKQKYDNTQRTTAKVAAKVNSSPAAISRAKAVKERAPDLFKQMKDGKLKTNSAYNQLKQREKVQELERKARESEFLAEQPEWTLIHGDVVEKLESLGEQSLSRLIFTDPPYNIGVDYGEGKQADLMPKQDYLSWCDSWMALCKDQLTHDGSFWLLVSDEFAAELCCIATELGFHRRAWVKWFEGFGVNCANNFNRTTRHIFWFVVDPKSFVFHPSEVMRPSDRQARYGDIRAAEGGKIENDLWQIPRLTGTCKERIPAFPTQIPLAIADRIVRCATDPGDLVLDPFNGSGTTGVAAVQNGRKYIGIDKSEEFIDLAKMRIGTAEAKP